MEWIRDTRTDAHDQAQALSDFLWNDRKRHREDIEQIERDLKTLEEKRNVTPVREVTHHGS